MTEKDIRLIISESKQDGFRTLFKQYQSYVYAIVWDKLRFIGTPEDAEECVCDVFTEVFTHFGSIEEGSLKAYIGTIAKRTAIHKYRRLSSKKEESSGDEELADLSDSCDIAMEQERKEEYQKLLDAILSLGEPDKTIIIQKYFYDRRSADIAQYTGLSSGAVRVRLNRALKRLKKILTENEEGGKNQ